MQSQLICVYMCMSLWILPGVWYTPGRIHCKAHTCMWYTPGNFTVDAVDVLLDAARVSDTNWKSSGAIYVMI